MKTIILKKSTLTIILIIFTFSFFYGQTPKSQIKKSVLFLKNYRIRENSDFDMDKYANNIGKDLVSLFRKEELSVIESENLGIDKSISSKSYKINVYNFGYDSGGTRGFVTHPILQWKNKLGKLFSYNISNQVNCRFDNIFKLKSKNKNLYILLGQEKGSGGCLQNIVFVIEINNDRIITNHKIFVNRPYINLCNVNFKFNERKQNLIGIDEYKASNNLLNATKEQGIYSKSETDNNKLIQMLSGIYEGKIILHFDGIKFTKK